MTPIEQAYESLEGLAVGDSFGEQFFCGEREALARLASRIIRSAPWQWTDDTNMALSIVECLRDWEEIDQQALAESFAEHYSPYRGYGAAMHTALTMIAEGVRWQPVAKSLFGGEGSFGN